MCMITNDVTDDINGDVTVYPHWSMVCMTNVNEHMAVISVTQLQNGGSQRIF